tara:strand:- start:2047 stop:2304 length:258 start_codon:yes stop_codon:yes gene_type:complete
MMAAISDADKKEISGAMQELSNCMLRTGAEKDLMKEIVSNLHEKFEIPKKVISKMAKVYHNQNLAEEVSTHDEFVILYHRVTGEG